MKVNMYDPDKPEQSRQMADAIFAIDAAQASIGAAQAEKQSQPKCIKARVDSLPRDSESVRDYKREEI